MEHIQGKVGNPEKATKICETLILPLLFREVLGNITELKQKSKACGTTEISEIFSSWNQPGALLLKNISG